MNSFRPDFSKGSHAGASPIWASLLPATSLTFCIPGKRERAYWQDAMMAWGSQPISGGDRPNAPVREHLMDSVVCSTLIQQADPDSPCPLSRGPVGLPGCPAEPGLSPFSDGLNTFIKHPLREAPTLPLRRYQCDGTINTQAQIIYRSLRDT